MLGYLMNKNFKYYNQMKLCRFRYKGNKTQYHNFYKKSFMCFLILTKMSQIQQMFIISLVNNLKIFLNYKIWIK